MGKVSFRREILVAKVGNKYENMRVCVEREETVREGESADSVFYNLRKWVDNKVADEVVAFQLGVEITKVRNEQKMRSDMRKAVIQQRGLFADLEEDNYEFDRCNTERARFTR